MNRFVPQSSLCISKSKLKFAVLRKQCVADAAEGG